MPARLKVQLNPDVMPRLRVHDVYANALRGGRGSRVARARPMQQRLQEARWFIKNIQQRFDTILRVSTAIVERQRNFFMHGELAMRPLVLREIADELGLHESTISRVTTASVYMATPFGTYELKYFFGSSLGTKPAATPPTRRCVPSSSSWWRAKTPKSRFPTTPCPTCSGEQGHRMRPPHRGQRVPRRHAHRPGQPAHPCWALSAGGSQHRSALVSLRHFQALAIDFACTRPWRLAGIAFWLKLGFVSFGGPAGQIALMHQGWWRTDAGFPSPNAFARLNCLHGDHAAPAPGTATGHLHRLVDAPHLGRRGGRRAVLCCLRCSFWWGCRGCTWPLEICRWWRGCFLRHRPAVTAIVLHAAPHRFQGVEEPGLWALAFAALVAIAVFRLPFPRHRGGGCPGGGLWGRWVPGAFKAGGGGHAASGQHFWPGMD